MPGEPDFPREDLRRQSLAFGKKAEDAWTLEAKAVIREL